MTLVDLARFEVAPIEKRPPKIAELDTEVVEEQEVPCPRARSAAHFFHGCRRAQA